MKYFSRKRKPKRFYVLVGLFTAMTLTVWANLAHTDSKAELTLEPGSKDDQIYTACTMGREDIANEMVLAGGVSSGKAQEILNSGYCLQYMDSWKAAGKIPSDFTPASQKSSSSSSNTSSNDTQATTADNSSDSKKSDTNSTKTYTDAEIDAAWKAVTTVDPTCATDGYTEYKNSLTGKTKQEAIPATGKHTYEVTDTTDAT